MLKVKSKLNSIEILTDQALIDLEVSQKEFKTVVNEKRKEWKKERSHLNDTKEWWIKWKHKNIRDNTGNA